MFTSSVRRVALAAQPSPLVASIAATCPRAVSTQALSYRRTHQRRSSSSSKPSSPSNGSRSKGIPDGQAPSSSSSSEASNPTSSPKVAAEKQPSKSRGKAKEPAGAYTVKGRDKTVAPLGVTGVASTHHIKAPQIAEAAFYSLHRPLSVTSSLPKAVTEDAFAAIFTPRTKANKPSDVISTLSRTVTKLEAATQKEKWNNEADELRAAITAESYNQDAEVKHLDQNPGDALLSFPDHILSGQYQPFNPPPAPKPIDTTESLAAGLEATETAQPQHRTYTAVLTVEESTDENGNVTWNARSSALVEEPSINEEGYVEDPRDLTSFRDRMNHRQQRFEEAREERAEQTGIWAISVKRQRKLKMKKHKYKKLMRRTRNLRRRLDRS